MSQHPISAREFLDIQAELYKSLPDEFFSNLSEEAAGFLRAAAAGGSHYMSGAIRTNFENFLLTGGTLKMQTKEEAGKTLPWKPVHCGIEVSGVGECVVSDLFRGTHIARREKNYEQSWNKLSQPAVPIVPMGKPHVFELTRRESFDSLLIIHVRADNDTTLGTIKKRALEQGTLFSPKQVDEILHRTQLNEPTGLRIDGMANLLPVWDGRHMFYINAQSGFGGWEIDLHHWTDDQQWYVGNRVIFRN